MKNQKTGCLLFRSRIILSCIILTLGTLSGGCEHKKAPESQAYSQAIPVQLFLDDTERSFGSLSPDSEDNLRVYITLDGMVLIDLPFSETHTVRILQVSGDENTVRLTGDAVFMENSNCKNHDCMLMGEITRDNLEMRVMGGFIICLPHRLGVEVRDINDK